MPTFTPLISSLQAYPYNVGMAETFSYIPISTQDRPLYAKAVYAVNGSSTGFTKCQTLSGVTANGKYPAFTPQQILIHNEDNQNKVVELTLTSGMSCAIPVGKSSEPNHVLLLNLSVSAVNNRNGCVITFFA
jgi:hypothetical protein